VAGAPKLPDGSLDVAAIQVEKEIPRAASDMTQKGYGGPSGVVRSTRATSSPTVVAAAAPSSKLRKRLSTPNAGPASSGFSIAGSSRRGVPGPASRDT